MPFVEIKISIWATMKGWNKKLASVNKDWNKSNYNYHLPFNNILILNDKFALPLKWHIPIFAHIRTSVIDWGGVYTTLSYDLFSTCSHFPTKKCNDWSKIGIFHFHYIITDPKITHIMDLKRWEREHELSN